MKLVLIVIACLFVFSCNQTPTENNTLICQAAKVGASFAATKIAAPWQCDQSKIYNLIVVGLNKTLCKPTTRAAKSIQTDVCRIALGLVLDLGKEQIVSQLGCKAELVDLSKISELCANL